ncbi:MAG: exodeoxyribonuclease V subunit gamma, partial [Gemmatimonadaceae bacterium]|nr:exodeoxyribonuclease V subunit gamma [Gemmatimonadaceae bacterium]
MSLTLVTADRVELLADRLIGDLGDRPLSVFERDVIVVQSQGTARWLRNTLATRTGCAASIEFPFPASFCRDLARALGHDGEGVDPAFTREAMTWRILELLGCGLAMEPAYAPLRRFVENADMRKQAGLAVRIASRFDDYQMYRAGMLLAWEAGLVPDGAHARWQADLWRRLCGDGAPLHLARWFTQAIERIEGAAAAPAGLPPRIAVFGVSTLPPLFVRLL